MTFKEKATDFMENKFLPKMVQIASNKYLVAIKDGFVFTTPFIIVGSFVLLLFNLPLQDPNNFLYFEPYSIFVKRFQTEFIQIYNCTMGMMALFGAFGIGYSFAGHYNMDKPTCGFVSLYAFLLLSAKSITAAMIGSAASLLHVTENTNIAIVDARYLDAKGLFIAIICGLVTVEISRFLMEKNIMIKLPDSVPPAIAKSFEILIPVAVISILFQIVNVIIQNKLHVMIPDLLLTFIQPLLNMADGLPAIIIFLLLIHVLWFCGIHGANIVGPIMGLTTSLNLSINQAALTAGEQIPKIFAGEWMAFFAYTGGSGATLGLCIAMLMSKNAQVKAIGKLAIVPGIFNINEPIIFGIPIVMNPLFAIPFVLTPIINAIISYILMELNIISRIVALVPWTTPSPLAAFIATNLNFLAPVLVLGLVVLDYFIYKPFLNIYIKQLEKEEIAAVS